MEKFKAQPFGRFFLLHKIAQGGMAEIFAAIDTVSSSPADRVVIKKLLPKYADDKRFVSMLIDEAKITSLLEHANIVSIHDVGAIGRDFYLLLEYVEGRSLDIFINRMKSLGKMIAPSTVSLIVDRMSRALDYAHEFKDSQGRDLNLVHRDVTPGNILLGFNGEIKLTDFGIATASKDSAFQSSEPAFGKKFYMPPEQIKNIAVDRRSDIYSLGAVAYEMLTLRKLFKAQNEIELQGQVINDPPPPPSSVNNEFKPVDDIILKSLSKNSNDRYKSAGEFAENLKQIYPFRDSEPRTLSALLEKLFTAEILEDEKVLKISFAGLYDYIRSSESPKNETGSAINEDPPHESTEFIPNDLSESETGFLPKNEMRATVDDKPAASDMPGWQLPGAPVIKIKTKKITPEELVEIRKIQSQAPPLTEKAGPDITIPPVPKAPEVEEEHSDVLPPPVQPATGGEAKKILSIEESVDWDAPILGPKEKRTKPHAGTLKRFSAYAGILLVLILISVLALNHLISRYQPNLKYPRTNSYNPQTVSVIIFCMKPTSEEKKAFEKFFSEKSDAKYDNIGKLKIFMQKEYGRLKHEDLDFLNLSFIGPYIVDSPPPDKTKIFDNKNIADYFEKAAIDNKVSADPSSIKVYLYLYGKKLEDPSKYPIIYRDFLHEKSQIVFIPLLKEEINASIILLANRILATFGASDKMDTAGIPVYPDGFADPEQNPLYPQRYAEIMAQYVPETPKSVRVAKSLDEVRIGVRTAYEIGWLNQEEYEKAIRQK